jgi:hypothetical protein
MTGMQWVNRKKVVWVFAGFYDGQHQADGTHMEALIEQ